jgi:serralysin
MPFNSNPRKHARRANLVAATTLLLIMLSNCGTSSSSDVDQEHDVASDHDTTFFDSLQDLRFCTELFPDDEYLPHFNYSEFQTKLEVGDKTLDSTSDQLSNVEAVEIAGALAWRWEKQVLNVMFLEGDSAVVRQVRETAKRWEQVSGVRFRFSQTADPDITITFQRGGSWSYVGSYCKLKRPSMNFGWLKPTSDPVEVARVVLHEFGHALGFIHEHQQPNANFRWNKPAVYAYYRRTQRPPWPPEKVDANIFQKYEFSQVNATQFDSSSIMLYSFPASFMLDGRSTPWNAQLSKLDSAFANQWFPRRLNR